MVQNSFTEVFRLVIDKHAPLKTKIIRGSHVAFMTKALSKAKMTRLRIKLKYNKIVVQRKLLSLYESQKLLQPS